MNHRSRLIPTVLTTVTLLCSGNVFAQDADLLRNLFQRLEVYLGIMQANEREHQNLLRSVAPPDAEQSALAGEQIQELTDDAAINGTALAAYSIGRNMLQTTNDVNNTAIVTRHVSGYCSAEEAEVGICQFGLTVDEGGAADLLADTLLANPTLGRLNNAVSFIYMLTNPSPIPLPDGTFVSEDLSADIPLAEDTPMHAKFGDKSIKARPLTSEGVRTLAARYKQMALLSTAQFALNNIAAERNPDPDQNGMSAFAALKLQAERRFNSPDWHEELNTLPDTAVLRELATMQAMQLALDFKRYEQEQTILTLLAAQVATTAQTIAATENAYQMQK